MEIFQVPHIDVLPVSADMIRQATQRDPILSRVVEYTKHGWKRDETIPKKKKLAHLRGWLPYVGLTSDNSY